MLEVLIHRTFAIETDFCTKQRMVSFKAETICVQRYGIRSIKRTEDVAKESKW